MLRPIGAEVVVAGEDFRFGHAPQGDLALLERLGFDARPVPLVEGVSSRRIRELLRAGDVERAAALLGRPAEVEGMVVAGDPRGGTLGFPTANLASSPSLLVPAYGIYAGAALGTPRGGLDRRRTRTTAAASGGSRRSCSTSTATSTASGWSSSSGSGCATSGRSSETSCRQIADVEATAEPRRDRKFERGICRMQRQTATETSVPPATSYRAARRTARRPRLSGAGTRAGCGRASAGRRHAAPARIAAAPSA